MGLGGSEVKTVHGLGFIRSGGGCQVVHCPGRSGGGGLSCSGDPWSGSQAMTGVSLSGESEVRWPMALVGQVVPSSKSIVLYR